MLLGFLKFSFFQALNDLGDQHNLPFEFVDGYISQMSVSIPWASLLTDSSYVEVNGMVITVQPKQRQESGTLVTDNFVFIKRYSIIFKIC